METLAREIENFYVAHRQQLFTSALAVTRCQDLAEDAIQDAFFRLFRLGARPENLKAYTFRAVRNAALDLMRARHRRDAFLIEDSLFDSAASPRDQAADKEFHRRLDAALQILSEDERETIVQHLYSELTFREIAEIREIPIGTVTSWYRRGMQKLREYLETNP